MTKENDERVLKRVAYFEAVKAGNVQKIMAYVDDGMNCIELTDMEARNALHVACEHGQLGAVQYMIGTCHVCVEVKEYRGKTALHFACENGHLAIVKYLIETGRANTEARDRTKWTPLCYASEVGSLDIVRYLIDDRGANAFVKVEKGRTVYDIAHENGMVHVTNYFRQRLQEVGSDSSTSTESILTFDSSTERMSTIDQSVEPIGLEGLVIGTGNQANALPTIYDFPNEYTINDLPWYVVVIGAQDSMKRDLGESSTYRNIRNKWKSIPLDVLYFKLLQVFQQYYGRPSIPTRKDQLLFVYWDTDQNVFRPLHLKSKIEGASRQDIQDLHVVDDIKKNRTGRELTAEEWKDHLGILLQVKRQDIESMAQSMEKQIVSDMLSAIEEAVHVVTTDDEFEKLSETLMDTWERFFPKSEQIRKKKDQLLVRIQQKRQAIEPMAQSMDGQILSNLLSAVEEAVEVVTTDRDIRTLTEHVRVISERFYPSTKKRKTEMRVE